LLAVAPLLLLGVAGAGAATLRAQTDAATTAPAVAAAGEPVDATLTDGRWSPRRLSEFAGTAGTVVFFTAIDCPIAQRYLPRIGELAREFAPPRFRFLVVSAGRGDGLVDAAAQQVEAAPATTFGKDFDGALARALGVERTATAVVLDASRTIVYRGRVDAQYRYAGTMPNPGRADLHEALADIAAGRPVAVAATVVEGCKLDLSAAPAAAAAAAPTFFRDVLPLLQQHCQDCHRDGGEGPFALAKPTDCRAHLEMIGEVVAERRMPPWYGSRAHGDFVNVRGLDDSQRALIAAWLAAGAPDGKAADAPPPRTFPQQEWRIGEPDLVLKVPAPIRLPAEGYVPYRYFVLPYRFEQDTWVEGIEIKPELKNSLHHCNLARVQWGQPFSQDGFVTGQVPGGDAMVLDPGTAVRIPAGSALVLQAHYVTTGAPVVDRLRVGLRFPRTTVDRELRVLIAHDSRFEIPAGAPAYPVQGRRTLKTAARGIGLFVHMHLRGRDMTVTASTPDGGEEKLLVVPNYNFDWQQSYRWGKEGRLFAAGTRIAALAHFDNSTSNPFNPDPTVPVHFGQETVDEMMYAFLFYTQDGERLGLSIDPHTGRVQP